MYLDSLIQQFESIVIVFEQQLFANGNITYAYLSDDL